MSALGRMAYLDQSTVIKQGCSSQDSYCVKHLWMIAYPVGWAVGWALGGCLLDLTRLPPRDSTLDGRWTRKPFGLSESLQLKGHMQSDYLPFQTREK